MKSKGCNFAAAVSLAVCVAAVAAWAGCCSLISGPGGLGPVVLPPPADAGCGAARPQPSAPSADTTPAPPPTAPPNAARPRSLPPCPVRLRPRLPTQLEVDCRFLILISRTHH